MHNSRNNLLIKKYATYLKRVIPVVALFLFTYKLLGVCTVQGEQQFLAPESTAKQSDAPLQYLLSLDQYARDHAATDMPTLQVKEMGLDWV